jgi:hypothetical protein
MGRNFFCGAALAALGALWLTPAIAAPVVASADLNAGYNYSSFNKGGGAVNDWMINGAGVVPIGTNWAVQGNAGYSHITGSGGTQNNDYGVASGFYSNQMGRLGASVAYTQLYPSQGSATATSYGAFVDWYASDMFTLSGRGGGISGSISTGGHHVNASGADYFGGQAIAYLQPNLALNGAVDYVRLPFSGVTVESTSYGVGGEYLLSQAMPLSVSAGSHYTNYSLLGFKADANVFSVSLKYYFGGNGSLEDHQRSGEESWGVASPVQGLYF